MPLGSLTIPVPASGCAGWSDRASSDQLRRQYRQRLLQRRHGLRCLHPSVRAVRPLRLLALDVMGSFPSLVICCRFGPSALSNVCILSRRGPHGVPPVTHVPLGTCTGSRRSANGTHISRGQHMSISQTVLAGPPSRVVESPWRIGAEDRLGRAVGVCMRASAMPAPMTATPIESVMMINP
jgi:hypothetical protein